MKKNLLALFLLSWSALASSELTIYFIPSPVGMDWSSPKSLALSALKNKLKFEPHFMGHVWAEVKCDQGHELTGMVGKNFDYLNQLLVEQRGLGVLYHSFEGRLEDKADIQEEMKGYFKKGGMNFVRFILNPGQCQRALTYIAEYRRLNVGRYYGLANRPRHGEGAGCTAFGTSVVDVLNLIDQEMRESWSQTVNIPLELAGPPLRSEGVSLLKIMFSELSWAKESQRHARLTFWDPDRMFAWVKAKAASPVMGYQKVQIENVTGVLIDKSHLPVPQEPIWQQQLDPKDPKQTLVRKLENSYERPPKSSSPVN